MNRLLAVQTALLELIDAQEGKLPQRDEPLSWERVHMASAARIGWLMAEERGEDPCLAACACAVHDIGRIVTGRQEGHAEAGREPVRGFLGGLELFSGGEIDLIACAVACHSSKTAIGSPLEEIVKDADVVDCRLYGLPFTKEGQKERFDRWTHRHSL